MNPLTTVFLDRDGTINVRADEGDYVRTADDLRLLPGAARAVAMLNRAAIKTVLITNQRGVARGLMSADQLDQVHARLAQELRREGAHLDAVYVCPHPADSCVCRKPGPGLIHQALREDPAIRLEEAVVVGDADTDIQLGLGLGIRTVRVAPCPGIDGVQASHTCPDLEAAVSWILQQGLAR